MTEEMLAKIEYALGLIAAGDKAGVDLLYVHMGRVMLFIARSVVCLLYTSPSPRD